MDTAPCNFCDVDYPVSEFRIKGKGRVFYECRKCSNRKQRERRANNNNKTAKLYEKSLKGKLVRTYRNMKSRVEGIQEKKDHLYGGLKLMDKEEFYKWSLSDLNYHKLHQDWVDSGYSRGLSPSIDRKNPDEGYILGNVRWVTHSFNSKNTRRWKNKTQFNLI